MISSKDFRKATDASHPTGSRGWRGPVRRRMAEHAGSSLPRDRGWLGGPSPPDTQTDGWEAGGQTDGRGDELREVPR